MHKRIISIVGLVFALSTSFSEKALATDGLTEYIGSFEPIVYATYAESRCDLNLCLAKDFIALLKEKTRLQNSLRTSWVGLKAATPEVRAHEWIRKFDLIWGARGTSDPLINWLIFKLALLDLDLKNIDPAFLVLKSEEFQRAFKAFQLQSIEEEYEKIESLPLDQSLSGIRIILLSARARIFMAKPESYAMVLRTLKSEVFKSPEIVTSVALQAERQWAWYLLNISSEAFFTKEIHELVNIVSKKYFSGANIYSEKDKNIQRLLNKDQSLFDELILGDFTTSKYWQAL